MSSQLFSAFLIVFTFCIQLSGYCQRDSIRVNVFEGVQSTPRPLMSNYVDKNYVRFNPYLIGRGVFAVGYERLLHRKHALAVDVGLTYRDFLYEIFQDEELDADGRTITIGNYVEVAYKFYPKSHYDFDGAIYLSPGFVARSYHITEDVYNYASSASFAEPADVGYSMADTFLRFGYVRESWAWDDVISDLYFGIGYRKMTTNTYEVTDSSSGGQEIKSLQETKFIPCVYAGIKIGFVF